MVFDFFITDKLNKQLAVSRKRFYLDFKKGRTKRGPPVDDFEEGEFGLFSSLS